MADALNKTPDFEPPLACVNRVIKSCLKENIQVTKDARASFTRAAGIFIFYITQCANDFAKDGKRSTITAQDILNALKELEFEEFIPPLENFLAHYRKEVESESSNPKKKARIGAGGGSEELATAMGGNEEDNEGMDNDDEDVEDEEGEGEEGAGGEEGGVNSAGNTGSAVEGDNEREEQDEGNVDNEEEEEQDGGEGDEEEDD